MRWMTEVDGRGEEMRLGCGWGGSFCVMRETEESRVCKPSAVGLKILI